MYMMFSYLASLGGDTYPYAPLPSGIDISLHLPSSLASAIVGGNVKSDCAVSDKMVLYNMHTRTPCFTRALKGQVIRAKRDRLK